MKLLGNWLIIFVLTSHVAGQWPLGSDFYKSMALLRQYIDNMSASVNNKLAANMRHMEEQMARKREALEAISARRAQFTRQFGPGGNLFTTGDGGKAYVYNSPDGSYSSYSYSSGPQSSGYIYHSGPDGTYSRHW